MNMLAMECSIPSTTNDITGTLVSVGVRLKKGIVRQKRKVYQMERILPSCDSAITDMNTDRQTRMLQNTPERVSDLEAKKASDLPFTR